MSAPVLFIWTRLSRAVTRFFSRVAAQGANDGLEDYLSTARSLHQLEDMQRRWDQAQRGPRQFGLR